MSENTITLVGNLTSDPELRFSDKGKPVATFSIGVSRRVKKGDKWDDELQGFFRISCFDSLAENVVESVAKGSRVIVTGRLKQNSWTDEGSGARRHSIEVQADEIGPSLRFATAQIAKARQRERASV